MIPCLIPAGKWECRAAPASVPRAPKLEIREKSGWFGIFFQESLQMSAEKEGNDLAQSLWMRFSRGAVDAPSLEGFKDGDPGKLGKVS